MTDGDDGREWDPGAASGLIPDFLRRGPDGAVFYGWQLVVILTLLGILFDQGGGMPALASRLVMQAFSGLERPVGAQDWFLTVSGLTGGLMLAPLLVVAGWLVDRHGPRRMAMLGLPAVGIGFLCILAVTRVTVIAYVGIVLMNVGATVGYLLAAPAVLNHWFNRQRTIAMAVPEFGLRVWQVAAGPLLNLLIGAVGWAAITAGIGAAILVASGPLVWMIRDRPEDRGQHPDGIPADAGTLAPEYTWREALASSAFWVLIAAGVLLGAASIAARVISSEVAFALELGGVWELPDTVERVALIAAILAGGILGDRIPIRFALLGFGLLQAASIVALAAGGLAGLFLYHVLDGLGRGGRIAPGIAAYGAYFGRRRFATILGISILVSGSLNVPVTYGAIAGASSIQDATNSSAIPLLLALVVSIVGAALYLRVGRPGPAPLRAAAEPEPPSGTGKGDAS